MGRKEATMIARRRFSAASGAPPASVPLLNACQAPVPPAPTPVTGPVGARD
jgi:hypothetical protein